MKTGCITTILFLGIILLCNCENPVYQGNQDISELQSVWQYLKVYSIYQERVPSDPLAFLTPEEMLQSIGDSSYTRYYFEDEWAYLSKKYVEPTVTFDTLNENTAYIKIWTFESQTYEELKDNLWQIHSFPNVVLDLRDNTGGNLYVTDSIVELFLPPGIGFIKVRYRDYNSSELKGYTVPESGEWEDWETEKAVHSSLEGKNFAVLINGSTASASEILAAALKDGLGAHLVGDTTYGKGIGQIRIPRRTRSTIQVTFMRIRGMTDRTGDYHGRGIDPDSVPQEIIDLGEIAPFNKRQLFYAAKWLDPTIELTDIIGWPTLKSISSTNQGLYKITPPDPIPAR